MALFCKPLASNVGGLEVYLVPIHILQKHAILIFIIRYFASFTGFYKSNLTYCMSKANPVTYFMEKLILVKITLNKFDFPQILGFTKNPSCSQPINLSTLQIQAFLKP